MKVISEEYHAHLIQYLHLYWCVVPGGGYFRRNNLHQVHHTNTNVDIELSVYDTFLK
jgi:hypothetical protein